MYLKTDMEDLNISCSGAEEANFSSDIGLRTIYITTDPIKGNT